MSTTFPLHQSDFVDLEITESSGKFDIGVHTKVYDEWPEIDLDALTPGEALRIAAEMIYAVWCSYPEEADAMVAELAKDIPNYQNREQQ
jgi:hypothetical protein